MLKFFDLQIHFMAESKGGQRLHERVAVPLELLAATPAVCGRGQVSCCGVRWWNIRNMSHPPRRFANMYQAADMPPPLLPPHACDNSLLELGVQVGLGPSAVV